MRFIPTTLMSPSLWMTIPTGHRHALWMSDEELTMLLDTIDGALGHLRATKHGNSPAYRTLKKWRKEIERIAAEDQRRRNRRLIRTD